MIIHPQGKGVHNKTSDIINSASHSSSSATLRSLPVASSNTSRYLILSKLPSVNYAISMAKFALVVHCKSWRMNSLKLDLCNRKLCAVVVQCGAQRQQFPVRIHVSA